MDIGLEGPPVKQIAGPNPRIYMCNKFPGDAVASGPVTTLGGPLPLANTPYPGNLMFWFNKFQVSTLNRTMKDGRLLPLSFIFDHLISPFPDPWKPQLIFKKQYAPLYKKERLSLARLGYILPAMWVWMNHLISLTLRFLLYKMEIRIFFKK